LRESVKRGRHLGNKIRRSLARRARTVNNQIVGFREVSAPIFSESTVHRVERVPEWRASATGPQWRALCGVHIGETRSGGLFEFEVPVALDPESWRLAANCQACLAATLRRELGALP
jgi:hypothetical protein